MVLHWTSEAWESEEIKRPLIAMDSLGWLAGADLDDLGEMELIAGCVREKLPQVAITSGFITSSRHLGDRAMSAPVRRVFFRNTSGPVEVPYQGRNSPRPDPSRWRSDRIDYHRPSAVRPATTSSRRPTPNR